jgi:putrescine transport system substrate-binding protein
MATKKGVRRKYTLDALVAVVVALLSTGCGHQEGTAIPAVRPGAADAATAAPMAEEKVLNVYNWVDYIDPSLLPAFEKEYGIKVRYDVFDSNEVLETKMLTGKTGYDVVGPSAHFLQRQIPTGVYQKLDKTLLPNLTNLDSEMSRRVEANDPGNQYGVIYFWGTSGIGYNEGMIAAAMPNAPVDSSAMLFDPYTVKHFKDCGVLILDSPVLVVAAVLVYIGKDPNSESLEDLKAAEKVLLSIRPYVRYIDSSKDTESFVNGELCLAFAWSGDIAQARSRAKESGRTTRFGYNLPKEGALVYFDMLAIPADAPHPRNAHLFINYILRPDVAARNSSYVRVAMANAAAYKFVDPALYNDNSVYLREDQMIHLYPEASHSPVYARELNRTWTRFKTGR